MCSGQTFTSKGNDCPKLWLPISCLRISLDTKIRKQRWIMGRRWGGRGSCKPSCNPRASDRLPILPLSLRPPRQVCWCYTNQTIRLPKRLIPGIFNRLDCSGPVQGLNTSRYLSSPSQLAMSRGQQAAWSSEQKNSLVLSRSWQRTVCCCGKTEFWFRFGFDSWPLVVFCGTGRAFEADRGPWHSPGAFVGGSHLESSE